MFYKAHPLEYTLHDHYIKYLCVSKPRGPLLTKFTWRILPAPIMVIDISQDFIREYF